MRSQCCTWSQEGALGRLDRLLGGLLVIQALSSAILVIVGPFASLGQAATVTCVVSRGLVRWRRLLGGDGAEQMTSLALVAAMLAVVPVPSPGRISLAVAFIGGQLMLSYVTAGIAKLASPVWRAGSALPVIMATEFHGDPSATSVFRRFPRLAAALGWVVILFECLFPLVLFGPAWLTVSWLVVGLAFHVGCAVTMGLNNFLLAFPAAYPCVLVIRGWLSGST